MKPDKAKLTRWTKSLSLLMDEVDMAYGDPPQGVAPPKLQSLVRITWEAAYEAWKKNAQ